jgi:hypothetical protein
VNYFAHLIIRLTMTLAGFVVVLLFIFGSVNAQNWDGSSSSDWNTAANWSSNAVPTSADNVNIPAAPTNQPRVTSAPGSPAICNDFEIQTGASLTIDAGKALTVNGSTNNNGTLLVKANVTGIGSFINNGSITGSGTFQMEQYLTGAGGTTPTGVFHYVGSPVVGAEASGFDIASGNKLWSYNEAAGSYSQVTDGATVLSAMAGHVVRMGSDASRTLTGSSFNTGNQSIGLSRTGTSNSARGYNLVANPYPSTVSWNNATRTNLETTIVYRANQNGTMLYDVYNGTNELGTNNNLNGAVTGDISPGQAVWARVNADGNTGILTFENANRIHGTLAGIYKLAVEEGTVRMVLSNGTNSDEAILVLDAAAQDGFDDYDSRKYWANGLPQLYMNVANDTLVMNGLTSTENNPVVDLGMKLPISGNYSLNANDITVVGETIHLEDRMLSIFQDLNVQSSYDFTSVAGNISNRFALHFGMSVTSLEDVIAMNSRVYTTNGQGLNITLSDNTENGKVDVMDMAGRIVRSFSLNSTSTLVQMNVKAGIYLIRVETSQGVNTHRVMF